MNWAQRRQLIYLLCIFLFIGAIAALIINRITSVPPTCFDGKKNGNEVGVDCGGTCTFYCRDELSDPKVRWVRVFEIAPGIVHAIAYIEHSNPAAAARTATYEFKLYDAKNNIITTRAGETFIGPFGRTAIVETLIPVGNTIPSLARFAFTSTIPWEKVSSTFSQVVIKTDRTLLESFSGGTRLTATLENQSRYAFTNLDVVAVLYDVDDNAVAVSKALLKDLPAEGGATIYFTWPGQYQDVTRIEILPRFNTFTAKQL